MRIEIMREMAAELARLLEKDSQFKKRLMDKVMSLPEFRKMLAKMVVNEVAEYFC